MRLGSIRVHACGVRRLAEQGFPAGRRKVHAGRVRSPDRPEFTQAKARIGGRIDRRLADEGNLAKAGSTRSTLCTTIVPSKLQPIGRLARP